MTYQINQRVLLRDDSTPYAVVAELEGPGWYRVIDTGMGIVLKVHERDIVGVAEWQTHTPPPLGEIVKLDGQ